MTLEDRSKAPMTPREYVELIVLPTLHEALIARDDRRRAYLACLVVYHVADSLGVAEAARTSGFAELSKDARKAAAEEKAKDARNEARRRCGSIFDVVRGFTNGLKHPSRSVHLPGTEEAVPVFAFDTPGAGFGEGRWDVPGLAVHADNEVLFLDACAQQVLAAFLCAYPEHLDEISLSSFMDPGLRLLGLPGEPTWLAGVAAWADGKPDAAELWLFAAGPDGGVDANAEVRVGVVLTEAELTAISNLHRSFVAGEQDGRLALWRSELAGIVGQEVDLTLIAGFGEPGGTGEPAERSRGIRLWTRPAPADAGPEYPPTR